MKKSWKKSVCLLSVLIMLLCVMSLGMVVGYAAMVVPNLFPDGDCENGSNNWTNSGGTASYNSESEYVHSGAKSVHVQGVWARLSLRGGDTSGSQTELYKEVQKGLDSGALYQADMWTLGKNGAGQTGDITAGAALVITGSDGKGGWLTPRANLYGDYFYPKHGEWAEKKAIVGFLNEGGSVKIYNNGVITNEKITNIANLDIDLCGTGNGSMYVDDIVFKKTTIEKSAVITVKENGVNLVGKTITIKNSSGTALSVQPVIEDAEGVYTIKNLEFANMMQTYKYSIEGVALPDNTISLSTLTQDCNISSYNAIITVQDESKAAIKDATVTGEYLGESYSVVNNSDGTYSINNLFTDVNVTVSKTGFIDKKLTLTDSAKAAAVTLKVPKPATVIDGNAINNYGFEDSLLIGTQEPGKWNSESGVTEATTNEQEDGNNSLSINGTAAYRTDSSSITMDGAKKHFIGGSFMSLSAEEKVSISIRFTCSTTVGYTYPLVKLVTEEVLDSTFNNVGVVFGVEFNELEKSFFITYGETVYEHDEPVNSIAAIDFLIKSESGKTIYLDNFTMLEVYDLDFKIIEGAEEIKEATFEIIGYNGKKLNVTPVYSENKFLLKDMCGIVKITPTANGFSYPQGVFSKSNTSNIFEKGFTLVVTVHDKYDRAVTGAAVVARRGATVLATLTDKGDGTYTWEEASGTFNIAVTKDDYIFPAKTFVDATQTAFTIKATASPTDSALEEEINKPKPGGSETVKGCGGCGGSIFADSGIKGLISLVLGGLSFTFLIFICTKKNKKNRS